jgi:hypothetical protein
LIISDKRQILEMEKNGPKMTKITIFEKKRPIISAFEKVPNDLRSSTFEKNQSQKRFGKTEIVRFNA